MAFNHAVLVVRSITNAIKGQKILEQNGMEAYVKRSNPSAREGCGYAIDVSGDINRALTLLENAGIQISAIQGG